MSTAAILPGFMLPAPAASPSGAATASSAATFGELLSAFTTTGQDTAQQDQGETAPGQPETTLPEVASVASGQQQQQQWARALQPLSALAGPAAAEAVIHAPAPEAIAATPALPGAPAPAVQEQSFTAGQPIPQQALAAPAEEQDDSEVPVTQPPSVAPGPSAALATAQVALESASQQVVVQHSPSSIRVASPAPLTGAVSGRGPVGPGQQVSPAQKPAGTGPSTATTAATADHTVLAPAAPVQPVSAAPVVAAGQPAQQPARTAPASLTVGSAPAPAPAPAPAGQPVSAGFQPAPAVFTTIPAEPATAPATVAAVTEPPAAAAVEAAPRTADATAFQTVQTAAADGPRAAAAATQAAAPPPAAPQQPMATQLARPLFTLAAAAPGEHVMTMKVSPEDLGPVTVRAHISSEGVKLELFAAGDAGREAVRAALPDLRRELAAQGLGASLDLSGRNSPEQHSQQQSQQHRGNHGHEGPYRPNLRMVTDGEPATGQALRSSTSSAALDVIA